MKRIELLERIDAKDLIAIKAKNSSVHIVWHDSAYSGLNLPPIPVETCH